MKPTKRFLLAAASAALAFTFYGCSDDGGGDNSNTSTWKTFSMTMFAEGGEDTDGISYILENDGEICVTYPMSHIEFMTPYKSVDELKDACSKDSGSDWKCKSITEKCPQNWTVQCVCGCRDQLFLYGTKPKSEYRYCRPCSYLWLDYASSERQQACEMTDEEWENSWYWIER
jgi:hypothetical protein